MGNCPKVKRSKIKFQNNANICIGNNVIIEHSTIDVCGGELVIADNVKISNYNIWVAEGCRLYIGPNCWLEKGDNWKNPTITLWEKSQLYLSHHNRLRCDILCRFGGMCHIEEYNCINERSEIRCDEQISIGSFNMISYSCRIWDTNTHSLYEDDSRRRMTQIMYPNIGAEVEKPTTKPIVIGNDCLLGERCIVLKGSKIGNKCILGVCSVIPGNDIKDGSTAVGNPIVVK
ncbi:MAG: acyltransferase [Bacteroidales bacterium]|nr:acyltransferase [Bacteroidales bacterium]